jgi:hypothetical protein
MNFATRITGFEDLRSSFVSGVRSVEEVTCLYSCHELCVMLSKALFAFVAAHYVRYTAGM